MISTWKKSTFSCYVTKHQRSYQTRCCSWSSTRRLSFTKRLALTYTTSNSILTTIFIRLQQDINTCYILLAPTLPLSYQKVNVASWHSLQTSQWVIVVSSNSAIFQLYHGEIKLIFNEMIWGPLCTRPTRLAGFL